MVYDISIYGATTNNNLSTILLQPKRALKPHSIWKRKETVKHVFSDLGILIVYGLHIFETIMYCKQNADPILNNASHKFNTRPNRYVEEYNIFQNLFHCQTQLY